MLRKGEAWVALEKAKEGLKDAEAKVIGARAEVQQAQAPYDGADLKLLATVGDMTRSVPATAAAAELAVFGPAPPRPLMPVAVSRYGLIIHVI